MRKGEKTIKKKKNEISGTSGRILEGLTMMSTDSQKDRRNRVVIKKIK